jgi:hypothetical protein
MRRQRGKTTIVKSSIIVIATLAAACSGSTEPLVQDNDMTPAPVVAVSLPTPAAREGGTTVDVLGDPGGRYLIISNKVMSNGHREVMSRRSGGSGESYARREIDCAAGTVRYIGEGDTKADAQAPTVNLEGMTKPIPESITGAITAAACAG